MVIKILLVDDDPNLRLVLSDVLNAKGLETVPVETGAAAFAQIEQQDIDVALIDLKLADMSGLDVLQGIKTRSADTECILLTGYATQESAIRAINLGAYSYFQKPYDIEQLLVTIRHAGERRAAERALAKSEARLASIFRVAPVGIGVVIDRVFQQVNALMCKMTGYTSEELIGQSARMVYPDDEEFERVGREKYAQIREKDSGIIETRWRRKDGEVIDILLASTPLVAGDPSAGVTFTALDITERKLAEEGLRALSIRQEAILAAIPDILMEVDINKRYKWANPAGLEFFGEDVLGKEAAFYFEGQQDTYNQVDPLFDGNEEATYLESWQRRKDGKKRLLAWHCRTLKDKEGNVTGALSSAHDVTERKQAEEALRDSENLLSEAQAVAGLGSYLLDISIGTWKSSEILDELFGIGETYDRSIAGWIALIHSDDQKMMSDYLTHEVIGQSQEFDKEYRIIRVSDQTVRWVHGLGRLEFNAEGHPTKMHGTIQDITERKRHEHELEAEAMLAQSLSETLELNPLLEQVLNAARHAIPVAERGSLALMVDDEHLQVRAVNGYLEQDVMGYTYPITWGYAGRVARERSPMLISDIQKDFELQKAAQEASMDEIRDLRSAIAVPLLDHESIIGVLSLESARPDVFHEDDLRLLINFAIPTALIIERARLYEEMISRTQETAALLSTSLALNSLDLQATLQTIGNHAKTLFAADGCRIFLLEPDGKTLRCVLALLENPVAFTDLKIKLGEGVTGAVAASGQAEIVNDMTHDPRAVQVPGTEEEPEAIIFAPLKERERSIGVISIRRIGREHLFQPTDLELLKAFASMATSAVSNARLFELTRQRVANLEMLYESGLALNQLLTPKEIGHRIIDLLEQKMDWHHTTVRLYHPQNETLEVLAFNQPGLKNEEEQREAEERFNRHISRPGEGLSGWAFQNSQIVRSGDVGNDPRYVDTYPGLHSGLYVPIKTGQHMIGVISIESEEANAFSEADERLVNTLANQAASALENARLFEETHQRVAELETVNRISIALRVISNQDEMLAIVLEETLSALKASNGSINLWDDVTGQLHKSMARGWLSEFTEAPIEPGQGIFGTVFATGNMYLSRDFANDPLTRPEARGRLPFGWGGICVPIRSAQRMLGVMLVSIPSEREFDKNETRLLNTLADMTGNFLYRARLYEETTRRAEEFESLYEMNTAISAEHDLGTLLRTIVKNSTALLGTTAGGMYFYDAVNEELQVVVATHPSIPIGTILHLGEGAAGRVAQSRQLLRIDDYATWEDRSNKFETSQIRALLDVPIIFGGELIGVLVAHEVGASERKFTQADERLLSLYATQAAGAIRSARLHEETQRRLENLQSLREVDRVITSSFDLRPILSTVLSHTITQLGVDAADILLLNPALKTLEYAAGYGFHTRGIERTNLRLGQGHAGRAALQRRTIHISNLHETGPNFIRASLLAGENFLEYYGVPLISKGEVKGLLEVFHRSPLHPKPEWTELLETLAGQAAIAIDNSQLFEGIQRSNIELGLAYEATIEGWSRAMDLRDEETEGHTQRVTEKAFFLARALGMQDDEIVHLRRGALLHDIGKIGVPDHILLKTGDLTDEEWVIMRKHPQFAYEMLRPIAYLRPSLDIPYMHHEKWDGTGYPRGIKGEQIPLAARIFAIVDVYDALTSDRPYRKAWTKARTQEYIHEQSGKHFDPQVVEKFLQLFGNEAG